MEPCKDEKGNDRKPKMEEDDSYDEYVTREDCLKASCCEIWKTVGKEDPIHLGCN